MKRYFLKIVNHIKEKKFFKSIETCLLFFGLLFMFFLFQNELLAIFDETVLRFCENIKSTPYTNISFIIIIGLCIVLCMKFIVNGYRISKKIILPYLLITLIYVYCRINCGYDSIPQLFFNCGYSDILIIAGWGLIISARVSIIMHNYLRNKSRKQYLIQVKNRINITVDNPIFLPEEDQLDYSPIAQELCDRIQSIPVGKHCSVGLIAPWGTGKTSFLNLLSHHFTSKEYLILTFNPRHSKTPSLIQEDF